MSFFSMVISALRRPHNAAGYRLPVPWFIRRFLIRRVAAQRRRLVDDLQSTLLPEDGDGRRFVPATTLRSSTIRAVPTPVKALTALLDRHPRSRTTFRHLHIVETTLLLSKVGAFDSLPVRILEQAVSQLEQLATLNDGSDLDILHLQMRRKLGELRARESAARHATSAPAAAAPVAGPRFEDSSLLLAPRDSELMFDSRPAPVEPQAPVIPLPSGRSLIEQAMTVLQRGDARYAGQKTEAKRRGRRVGDFQSTEVMDFAETQPMAIDDIEPRRLRA